VRLRELPDDPQAQPDALLVAADRELTEQVFPQVLRDSRTVVADLWFTR
jgi:hypothetical protein